MIGLTSILLKPQLLTRQHSYELMLAVAGTVTPPSLQGTFSDILPHLAEPLDEAITAAWRDSEEGVHQDGVVASGLQPHSPPLSAPFFFLLLKSGMVVQSWRGF